MLFSVVFGLRQVWVHDRVEGVIASEGGMALWQRVLGCEWGGTDDEGLLSFCPPHSGLYGESL